jgi:hypothetical protein
MDGLEVTALDQVQHPFRPALLEQLPNCSCVVENHCLGGVSCTAYAAAMLASRSSGGRKTPSGCSIRRMSRDVVGGLTLYQVSTVLRDYYDIPNTVYSGSNVVAPSFLARQIRAGRGAVVQGGTGAYIGTPYKVTDGDVNHAEMWSEVRGGTLDSPADVLIYDSCADHRRPDIDRGPTWIPWKLALKFASYLEPGGEGTGHLGGGRIYCMTGPDTEPHVTLLNGAKRAHPLPDRVRAHDPNDPRTAIHSNPGGQATVTRHVKNGTLLRLYQYRDGWGYNDDGTECVLLTNTTHVGGAT